MLQNAYFLAKIGADTAENEQHFAEILPTDALSRHERRHEVLRAAGPDARDGPEHVRRAARLQPRDLGGI